MPHRHAAPGPSDNPVVPSPTTRRILTGVVVGCVAATLVGLLVLWPRGDEPAVTAEELGFAELVPGTVTDARLQPCSYSTPEQPADCDIVTVEVTGGPTEGDVARLEFPIDAVGVTLRAGDRIVLNYVEDVPPDAPPEAQYQFADYQRRAPMVVLAVLFAAAVVLLGRLRGLAALGGLAVSVAVLLWFLLPAIVEGKSPVAVALVGAAAIALVALYLAHGVNERTTVAVLGTLASLVLTGVLAAVFVAATNLTGLAGEETGYLRVFAADLDFRGLLLAGIVIGSLGVLDDVTVTQVSAVWELFQVNPTRGGRSLYAAAIRIGRDHIASTVNTLVLAYAGAALPLLLVFVVAERSAGSVVTQETLAIEVVRTLVGSIGLVASVPITTILAVLVVAGGRGKRATQPRPPRRTPVAAPQKAKPKPAWDDFAPDDVEV
ncbi:MAG: YibE/F family protein [Acidimicrobiales bacterium]